MTGCRGLRCHTGCGGRVRLSVLRWVSRQALPRVFTLPIAVVILPMRLLCPFSCGLLKHPNPEAEFFGQKMLPPGHLQRETHRYYRSWQHNVRWTSTAGNAILLCSKVGGRRWKRFSFQIIVSAPVAPSSPIFTALVVGEMGGQQRAHTRARDGREIGRFNCTIHVGDISYADDSHVRPIEPSSGSNIRSRLQSVSNWDGANFSLCSVHGEPRNHDVSQCNRRPRLPKAAAKLFRFPQSFFMPSARSVLSTSKAGRCRICGTAMWRAFISWAYQQRVILPMPRQRPILLSEEARGRVWGSVGVAAGRSLKGKGGPHY